MPADGAERAEGEEGRAPRRNAALDRLAGLRDVTVLAHQWAM